MIPIYVVLATDGEWEEAQTRIVKAFRSEERADTLALCAQQRADILHHQAMAAYRNHPYKPITEVSEYDPDLGGWASFQVFYAVEETELDV